MALHRILVIGGYGNFGQFICKTLAREPDIQLVVAGRSPTRGHAFCASLQACNKPQAVQLDIHQGLDSALQAIKPDLVIHTSGPFQNQSYTVAEACIRQACHYIDLADGREFVCGIHTLSPAAEKAGVFVCAGASSVPGLSSALIEHYQPEFHQLHSVDYAISTAHKTSRGLATTKAVLSYAGKPFSTRINGRKADIIGWRGTRKVTFWDLGARLLGNCDIPDLQLFPQYYPHLKQIRFQAGLELGFIHRSLATMAWLVQLKLLPNLQYLSRPMMAVSRLFDLLGSENSGFFMIMTGEDQQGMQKNIRFDLVARNGDGLYIPTIPATVLALKLCRGKLAKTGASPCIGYVTLEEYLQRLAPLDIQWQTRVID